MVTGGLHHLARPSLLSAWMVGGASVVTWGAATRAEAAEGGAGLILQVRQGFGLADGGQLGLGGFDPVSVPLASLLRYDVVVQFFALVRALDPPLPR